MQEGFSVRFVRDAVETDVETVIAVWDFTENTLGVTEFNSDFSTLNGSAAVGDNNLGFFVGATDQVGDGNDNARTLTHKFGSNGFTGTYMKPLALTSADLVDNKLHMSISFNSINIADGKLFKMFLKGPNSSNANNQVQRAIGIYLDQVNGVIQVKKVGPNNSQYGAAAIVGDLGATYDQSITLGVTLDWNAKTTDFWIGQPGGSDGLQNANNLSTGWTEATGDAAGYILDQLQFQVNLVDSSVEVDQIKFSTGSYQNTVAAGNADTEDTEAPVITLIGESTVSIDKDATYIDQGATATDNIDGDITANITATSTVDTSTVGTYTVTYTVSDAAGNAATPVERAVNVLGTQRYADGTATDQDGNSFEWINYGTQDWSIENAEVVTYRDGTEIPQVTDDGIWASLTTGAWCYYNNDSSKGKLYNWYAVMGIHDTDPNTPNKEFAPEGWNLPTDAEVTTLEEYLIANGYNYDGTTTGVTTTGNKIGKSVASTTGWESSTNIGAPGNDQSLNNSSGFNAFPYGERNESGLFQSEGSSASFWSSIEGDLDNPFYWGVSFSSTGFGIYSGEGKRFGFLARFVRDVVDTEAPVITLIGESPVSIDKDATYIDQGATATDNIDGDITANITATSTVDTSTAGTYTVTYTVSDAAGNAATPVVRTITVNPVEINPTETGILLNGTVSAENNQIKNVADPTEPQDAATKAYIDAIVASQGLINFSGWDNYQVWDDNTTVNLTPNSFVFINADNTTLVLPDNPDNCCFGDAIYIYIMRNANSARPATLKTNNLVIRDRSGNQASSGQSITGVFQGGGGLQMIINVGDYWMAGSFQKIDD